jgi:uncharacterized protein (DUF1697 family)
MHGLRALLEELRHESVATYIQSGNAIFRSAAPRAAVSSGIEQAIGATFGLNVKVLLRTPAELAKIESANPFLGRESDLAKLHVVVLDSAPARAAVGGLDPDRSPGDEFRVIGREIYLHYPHGAGRTKLTLDYFERRLGVSGTARNWKTLLKLLELAEAS